MFGLPCLFDIACFFLPSHLSLKTCIYIHNHCMYMYMYMYIHCTCIYMYMYIYCMYMYIHCIYTCTCTCAFIIIVYTCTWTCIFYRGTRLRPHTLNLCGPPQGGGTATPPTGRRTPCWPCCLPWLHLVLCGTSLHSWRLVCFFRIKEVEYICLEWMCVGPSLSLCGTIVLMYKSV